MKGRGRGRDVHAADSQHSMDAASAQPSRGGRQYAQDPAQQSPSSPEAAPSGSGWEDGFTAPARQAGRGLPGRGRTGRATVVTPAEIFAQAEDVHASATGSGRRSRSGAGSSQHRPTFYGREVSSDQIAGQQPAHQVGPGQGAVHPEAPAGSRRYLANRGDAGRGPGGPHADAAVAMAAAPSMVPVHHVDDDSQNVHFNPNAPGFLPMGGEGGEAVVMVPAGGAVHAVSSSAPPGRAPGASHLPLISSGLRDVSCVLPVEITGTAWRGGVVAPASRCCRFGAQGRQSTAACGTVHVSRHSQGRHAAPRAAIYDGDTAGPHAGCTCGRTWVHTQPSGFLHRPGPGALALPACLPPVLCEVALGRSELVTQAVIRCHTS